MKSINYTLAPLVLCLVACAPNQPPANVSSNSGNGKYAGQGARSNSSGGSSYGSGASGSSSAGVNRSSNNTHGGNAGQGNGSSSGRNSAGSQQKNDASQQLVYEKSSSSSSRSGNVSGGNSGLGGDGSSARNTTASQQKNAAVVGSWSGNDGQQRIAVKFGANGSLIINNAAGANPGQWSGGSGGRFRIQVGSFNGEFVMVDSRTGSLTLGDSSVELKR